MTMIDWERKERIKKFVNEIVDDYEAGLDENDIEDILLRFEDYLMECEEERMKR